MYGICDDSMEKNPLKESSLDFCKPFELRDAGWYILGGGILLLLFIVIFLWIKRKKNRVEQPVETQKVEYEIQHVVTEPKAVISSAGENSSSVKMLMELVSGAQAGGRSNARYIKVRFGVAAKKCVMFLLTTRGSQSSTVSLRCGNAAWCFLT